MKATCYICTHWNKYSKKFEYNIQGYEPSSGSGYVLLESRELEFETPNDVTLRQRIAVVLRDKKNKILADAHVESLAVDEEIQELLAIEDKSNEENKTGPVAAPEQSDDTSI